MHRERLMMTPYPLPAWSPPRPRPIGAAARARRGFTFIEVMISVCVLATALVTMMGTIYSLNAAHQGEREDAIAQQLANSMVERVMGANFATLGQSILPTVAADQNAWSWQRRATLLPTAVALEFGQTDSTGAALTQPVNPPLQEYVPTSVPGTQNYTSDLVALGIEPAPSGLTGLRVYVEYYNMDILLNQQALSLTNPAPAYSDNWPHWAWVSQVGDPTQTDPTTSPPTFLPASTPTYIPAVVGTAPATLTPPLNIFQPEYSGVTPIYPSVTGLLPALSPVQINVVAVTNANALADVQSAMTRNSAVMVRILVFWVTWKGGHRWHEITVIRRGDS
jgi:type II secretory pathway pseudopilin PulG